MRVSNLANKVHLVETSSYDPYRTWHKNKFRRLGKAIFQTEKVQQRN